MRFVILGLLLSVQSCKTSDSIQQTDESNLAQTGSKKLFPFNLRIDQIYKGKIKRFDRNGDAIAGAPESCDVKITGIKDEAPHYYTVYFKTTAPKSLGGGIGEFHAQNTFFDAGRSVKYYPEGKQNFVLESRPGDDETERLRLEMVLSRNARTGNYDLADIRFFRPTFGFFSSNYSAVMFCDDLKLIQEKTYGDGI